MNIREKVLLDVEGLRREGAVTVVAFGDSVTHGAVAAGEMDYDSVYWNRFRLMIQERYPYMPVNVINAGIGGITAIASLERMQRDVLDHHPDLVIVCFGLNDVNLELEEYLTGLREIFRRCREAGVDTIFMTPNMLNTYVADETAEGLKGYAKTTASYQNDGKMDTYIAAATMAAEEHGIPVCDCYAKWKAMAAEGVDTTALLANHINHPTQDMHKLFADSLYETIFGEAYDGKPVVCNENTMYQGK
jgi:lysophospholipase L1-like esterase